jgi:hypothetical protein
MLNIKKITACGVTVDTIDLITPSILAANTIRGDGGEVYDGLWTNLSNCIFIDSLGKEVTFGEIACQEMFLFKGRDVTIYSNDDPRCEEIASEILENVFDESEIVWN